MDIGIVGLGHMGSAIAHSLLDAGHSLTVWNRSADKAKPLVEAGAALAETPADAAGGDSVITMLADDPAVEAVVWGESGLLSAAGEAVHVSMSTISTALAARLARAYSDAARAFVSATVFGRPDVARTGELVIAAAGEPRELAVCAPLFEAVGRRTFIVGHAPEHANLVKLCGNFVMISVLEALAESMTLAERGGVASSTLLDVLTGSQFETPAYHNYGQLIAERRFRPAGFPATLALKDLGLVGDAAAGMRVPMPVLDILREHLATAIAREGEDVDSTALAAAVAVSAGMDVDSGPVTADATAPQSAGAAA
jgi:3-hydroxyisobutyrate dehydrogenase-like beta-hydroxyacid dehydrogenase